MNYESLMYVIWLG